MEYKISTGDNLIRIAKRFGVSMEAVIEANPHVTNPHMIYAGEVLHIPLLEEDALDEPAWLTAAYDEIEPDRRAASYGIPNPRVALYRKAVSAGCAASWNTGFVCWCLAQAQECGVESPEAAAWETWGEYCEEPRLGCVVMFQRAEEKPKRVRVGFYVSRFGNWVEILAGDIGGHIHIVQVEKENVAFCRWPASPMATGDAPDVSERT